MTISVAIVDDEPVMRMGLRALIERESDLRVVGETAEGAAAIELVRQHRPDVLLAGIRPPDRDGLAMLRSLTADPSLPTRAIVVTMFGFDGYVLEALRLGASGFLLTDSIATELVPAIRVVAAGDALLSPAVASQVIRLLTTRPRAGDIPPRMDRLTAREIEIMAWVATGRSNDEIAAELIVSPNTVRTHVSRAMVKLKARDRAQLVVFAIRAGLVVPD